MRDFILELNNICFSVKKDGLFQTKRKEILKNFSYDFERGKVYGLTGESGSGKTTLAKLIAGVIKADSGMLRFNFKDDWSNSLSSPVQILFQNDGYQLNPYRKIIDILTETFRIKYNIKGNFSNEIEDLFKTLGLNNNLLNRKGSQLSGGEQQRIALARISIVKPEILILDEFFSSQDIEAKFLVTDFVSGLNSSLGTTVISISHDIYALKEFADEIIILNDGYLIESSPTIQIFNNPAHSYTKFLLSAQSLNLTKDEIFSFISDGKNKHNQNN